MKFLKTHMLLYVEIEKVSEGATAVSVYQLINHL